MAGRSNILKKHRYFAPIVASIMLPLTACSTLPSTGPTGRQIEHASTGKNGLSGFRIVELTELKAVPLESRPAVATSFLDAPGMPPRQLLGQGDLLDIVIYESGVSLFAGSGIRNGNEGFDASAHGEKLPPVRIDHDGFITLPYLGRIRAAGSTAAELQRTVELALRGKTQNPQVVVSVEQPISNTIVVGGEVMRPGRLALVTNTETLWDALALSGGYKGELSDLQVRIERGGGIVVARLVDMLGDKGQQIRVEPGDRIFVRRDPLTYTVMGGVGRAQHLPFTKLPLSLAEALAQAGGADVNAGDPAAVFVFRFVADENGAETPIVYHLNLMKAQSYFLAQKFAVRNDDIIYVGNAAANQPSKLIQIISQLFAPIVSVRAATGN